MAKENGEKLTKKKIVEMGHYSVFSDDNDTY